MPHNPDNALRLALRAAPGGALKTFAPGTGGALLADVLLMATGREAAGHGVYLDRKTAETALAANGGRRLHAFFTHDEYYFVDDLSRAVGFFEGLYIDDAGSLRAKAFRFFESFAKANPEVVERITELATKTPDLICMSIEFWGYAVAIGKDGSEYTPGEVPQGIEVDHDGMPVVRITDLTGAAFVGHGAATDGLFARFAKLLGFGRRKLQRADTVATGGTATIQDIAATFGAQPERLARATKLFAANGGTVQAISAALAAQDQEADLTRLRSENQRLAADVATLTNERDSAREERDTARSQLAEIKDSGHAAPLKIGAPTATPKSTAEAMELFAAIKDPRQRAEFYKANRKLLS